MIIKQELTLSDVEQDDDDSGQSNYDINGTDDNSYMDDGHDQADVPCADEPIFETQPLVYDRPTVFECYLCHKSWPTVGRRYDIPFRPQLQLVNSRNFRSLDVSLRPTSHNGHNIQVPFVWQMAKNTQQFGATR